MASRPVLAWRVAQPECQLLKPGPQANVSQVMSVVKSRPDKLDSFLSPVSRKNSPEIMDSKPFLVEVQRAEERGHGEERNVSLNCLLAAV